ncbi:LSM domain protein [Staphylococcus ursi]|uniref:LSM domain protein n=1 Tax=Staphylococcus sp. MI 10-1553 TaxID=1912064 RepID=UPI0013993222|nr:LSM domain protein [Staphylococcus sp. MI 10-1553]QHW36872.1 LSM domain protein [Staphylococcus sp. MI 10-1553]QHW36963.1 LSM domain protein [Staphylococcus sp. MI 10-1553]
MKLWTYVGENAIVELMNGKKFVGKVTNFEDEIANNSGENSIHFDDGIGLYDFDESEIKSIEILE